MANCPHPVDQHVGSQIRRRRAELRMSQERLGNKLGLTFQQVQKYERGVNRVSASKLYDIAAALDTTIMYFFDGLNESDDSDAVSSNAPESEVLRLCAAFTTINDKTLREAVINLAEQLRQH